MALFLGTQSGLHSECVCVRVCLCVCVCATNSVIYVCKYAPESSPKLERRDDETTQDRGTIRAPCWYESRGSESGQDTYVRPLL